MVRRSLRPTSFFAKSASVIALSSMVALGIAGAPKLVDAASIGATTDTVSAVQIAGAYVAGETLVVNTDALNLRDDASTSANVLATLGTGETVWVTGDAISADGYEWYAVDTNYGTGYVAGEFLAYSVTVSFDLGITIGDSLVVDTDVLNLRDDATTSGNVLASLATGESVYVIDGPIGADGYTWYQVETDYGTGWIAGDYLAATVTLSSDLGFSSGDAVYVNTDALNLRADATVDGEVLAVLETGAAGTIADGPVSADGYTWYYVSTDAGSGWVAGEYLAFA